jgi:hypothetical protein
MPNAAPTADRHVVGADLCIGPFLDLSMITLLDTPAILRCRVNACLVELHAQPLIDDLDSSAEAIFSAEFLT